MASKNLKTFTIWSSSENICHAFMQMIKRIKGTKKACMGAKWCAILEKYPDSQLAGKKY